MSSSAYFGDRLAAAVAAKASQIVLGLDPDPARLWPAASAGDGEARTPAERAAEAVVAHCRAAIDATADSCVAVKPQLACFERLGAPGRAALGEVVEHARAAGLLVLADAKRGDIDVSAAAYAQALIGSTPTPFGDVEGLGADAFTAHPYQGADSLQSFVDQARPNGHGVFVLVRTSNPGAADLQDLRLDDGERVWERVARLVDGLGADGRGPASGLADVCAVTGATVPEHLARLRELMPATPFLLPGVGAQGGRVEDLAPAFAPGRAGGLVTSSRGIVNAYETAGGAPADAARREAERLRAVAWALGG
ncbi:MAG TPA: orotidine-5'-phosphate decarboxylase [Solirubrobacteraceae bacterium]|nr:orotidine-5'-phosphate decarboxylase [Solirubrobacteraceae bacterium]